MRTIGIITTVALSAAAAAAAVVGVRSIPDIRRYFRIRAM